MKIALIGYGKMGKAIEEIAIQQGHEIVLKITSKNLHELTEDNLKKADVAIEFTNPESAVENINACLNAGVATICGSTGWLQHLPQIEELCNEKQGCFLYASNFSIGVNLFFKLNEHLAQIMKSYDYDVKLKEIHHTQKKDAPSGTGITIAEGVLKHTAQKNKWVSIMQGEIINNEQNELVIISERTDPAPGTHTVTWFNDIDEIEITHTAKSRKGFASGAVIAAQFVNGKKGIYTMDDVLGL